MSSIGRYINVSEYKHVNTFQRKEYSKIAVEDGYGWWLEDNLKQCLSISAWKKHLMPENFNPNNINNEIQYEIC